MQIVLDIENTVIDDLLSLNFMSENCDRIKDFIKRRNPRYVHLFTWGWKNSEEIDKGIVDSIYERLGVPVTQRGLVYTKSDSVDYAIIRNWLKDEDRDEVLHPGMMAAYGLRKIFLLIEMFVNTDLSKYAGEEYDIIDDLVSDEEHNTRPYHNILLLNPAKEM